MKIPFHNETDKFVHIGGVTIPPFDTRDVEATLHPDYKAPKAEEEKAPDNPLAALLNETVKDILPKLPEMDMEQLTALEALEQEGKNRSSLIEAIAAAKLALAGKGD